MTDCGIDIIEIDRIKKAVNNTPNFLKKVYSEPEIQYFVENGERFEILAGFFAAKEAFLKYRKTGISGTALTSVSVMHDKGGAPFVELDGVRQRVSLSISHGKTCAVAVVCGEGDMTADIQHNLKELLPKRQSDANKGNFGKVAVIAGSKGMTGAAVLSAYSALRTGSGIVILATAESERAIAASFRPEIMTKGLACKDGLISREAGTAIVELAKNCNAVVFGPGIGQSNEIFDVLELILREYTGMLLIDADGLNVLSKNPEILKKKSCQVVLTPHPGEMARLCGVDIPSVQNDRQGTALRFAKEYGVCLVLKGEGTVVAGADGDVYVNTTGNPGMATAGSGDVLSGVIASLLGQGLSCFGAARLGVYIHGLAGDIAKEEKGTYGLVAGDIIETIPYAIKQIEE